MEVTWQTAEGSGNKRPEKIAERIKPF